MCTKFGDWVDGLFRLSLGGLYTVVFGSGAFHNAVDYISAPLRPASGFGWIAIAPNGEIKGENGLRDWDGAIITKKGG